MKEMGGKRSILTAQSEGNTNKKPFI